MGIPQIILVILLLLGFARVISKHGEDKEPEKYNFYKTFFYWCIHIALLIWGGFF